jgi:EH signature protein
MDAIFKLKEAIVRALGVTLEAPSVSPAFAEELRMLTKYLKGVGGDLPARNRLREAVQYFRVNGDLPSLPIARAVCFGAAERFSSVEGPVIEETDQFPRLLTLVDNFKSEAKRFRRCYRGLLHAYISYDGENPNTCETGRGNWLRLRDYLHEGRPSIDAGGWQPEWAECITQHANLLTKDPASRYASALLRGDTAAVDEIKTRLEVGDDSWLMRRLVVAQIMVACRESDATFKTTVHALLKLLYGHELLEDEGLALILNRYASIPLPAVHAELRDYAVERWGNPWLDSHSAKWTLASEKSRALVTGWFKLHVIRTFFELLSEDGSTDKRRVKFWQRYHEQIGDMYFALGTATRYGGGTDARQMRKQMENRLLGLKNAGSGSNNAFIMMIGNVVAVEFGITGNACFIYRRGSLPFELHGDVSGSTTADGLKSPNNLERLTHVDTAIEKWEANFSTVLQRHGASQPYLGQPPPRHSAVSPAVRLTRQTLKETCDSYSVVWKDNTANGGNLAVRYNQKRGPLAQQLVAWGFTFSDQREFWYRKDWP